MAIYCIKCGKELPDGCVFCPKCGCEVQKIEEPKKKRGRPRKNAAVKEEIKITEDANGNFSAELPEGSTVEIIDPEPEKKRGRPRKQAVKEEIEITEDANGNFSAELPEGSTIEIIDPEPIKNTSQKKIVNDNSKEKNTKQPTKKKVATRKSNTTKSSSSDSKKSGSKAIIPIALVAVVLFLGFVKPGFLKKKDPVYPNLPQTIYTINTDDDDSIPTPLPEKDGNSKPLAYSPREGFYIEAEADAFLRDTDFTITPLESVSDNSFEAAKKLASEGLYPIYGFDIDGGMKEEEVTPGEYHVTVDLSLTDLDQDLYPCLEIYRIADDGTYYECASEVKDGKITYRAEQNSVIMVIVNAKLASNGCVLWPEGKFNSVTFNKERKYYKGKNDYMTYKIDWVNSQLGIDMTEEVKRTEELVDKYYKTLEEEVEYNEKIFSRNARKINSIMQKLEADPEFKELEKAFDVPKEIQALITSIDLGMEYLAKIEGIRYPTKVVTIHAVDYLKDQKYADATGNTISVALKFAFDQGKTGVNNLTLTMTHELLHVCQRRYRFINPINDGGNDSVKYDEMVAGYAEARALNYFVREEVFESDAIPTPTNKNQWSSLKFPLEKEYTAFEAKWNPEDRSDHFKNGEYDSTEWDTDRYDFLGYINRLMINEGYNLAYLVNVICKDQQKFVSADTLMRARKWGTQTGIKEPLKTVFGLNETTFRRYYKEFINHYRNTIRIAWQSPPWYKTNFVKTITFGVKQRVTLSHEGDFSTDVHTFRGSTKAADKGKGNPKDPMSMLIVPDQDLQEIHPLCVLLPVEDYTMTNNGMFVGPLEFNQEENNGYRSIITIHTNESEDAYSKETGYNVYFFGKTCTITSEYVSGKLQLTIKDESEAYKDKVIDGYVLTINVGGSEMTTELKLDQINTPITINSEQLYNQLANQDGKVKVCPYILSADGKKLFTEESEEVLIPMIQKEETPVVEDKTEELDPIYKQGYKVVLDIGEMYDSDYWLSIARELGLKAELEISNSGEFTFKMPDIPIENYKKGNSIINGKVPGITFRGSLRDGRVLNGYQYSISIEKEGCVEPLEKANPFKYSRENTKLHTTWNFIEVEHLGEGEGLVKYHVPSVHFNVSQDGSLNFLIQMSSIWEFTEIHDDGESKTTRNSFATDVNFSGHTKINPDDFDRIVKSVDYAITNTD